MKEHVIYLDSGDDVPSTLDKLSWVKSARVLLVWPDKGNPLCTRYELVRISRYARQRGLQLGLVSFHPEVRGNARELGLPLFSSLEHLPADRWEKHRFTDLAQSPASRIVPERDIINGWRQEPAADTSSSRDVVGLQSEYGIDADSDQAIFTEKDQVASHILGKSEPVNGHFLEARLINTALDSDKSNRAGSRWYSSTGLRVLSVVLAACSLLALLGVSVPSAKLYIIPEVSYEETEIPIGFDQVGARLIPGEIPVEERKEAFTVTQYFLTTGRAEVGDIHAQGFVVFENPGLTEVTVPSGTGVRTERAVRFETLEAVSLEAGEVSEEVPVRAILAGESGNVAKEEIQWLDGSPGLFLTVVNPEALTGGRTVRVHAVSSYDLRSAEKKMMEIIGQEMELSASQLTEENEMLLPGSVELLDVDEGEAGVQAGDVAEGFQLSWTALIRMAVVQKSLVNRAGADLLASEMSSESFLISGSLDSEFVSPMDEDSETWNLLLQYQSAESVDFREISTWLAAKPVRESVPVLVERYSLAVSPYVYRFPSWLPVFPLIPSRIQVFWAWEVES
ncbi:MAG: baseplate J/gp47 family protein [Anaerolineales bacterium]|nr:baseplate J/gp47 family protein [Anaerolineales bacterium]